MPVQKPELVESPQESQRVVMATPVNPAQFERDMRFRDRAARRRDPDARNDAQATLNAAPRVNVILEPIEADRLYGDAHPDAEGNPQYPLWTCTYNGIPLAYKVGEPIELPVYIWEIYQHTRRRPAFRLPPGEQGTVFSRELPDNGALYEPPSMGR